jgi:uncharacterized protein (DUF1501 family)
MSSGSAAGGFESLYDGAVGDVLHGTGKESFEAMKMLKNITARPYVPANGAQFPRGRFGDALRQIAQLIKADVGVEIAFAESGGWDTHVGQGAAQGQLAQRLREFGQGLAALYRDLGDRMDDTVILTMSEFGRTARQNGNGGTDHGHATCFLALGGSVRGGRVLGQWPGLAPDKLYESRDLAHTTDFRDVFGEVAQRHLGVKDLGVVFPDRTFKPCIVSRCSARNLSRKQQGFIHNSCALKKRLLYAPRGLCDVVFCSPAHASQTGLSCIECTVPELVLGRNKIHA